MTNTEYWKRVEGLFEQVSKLSPSAQADFLASIEDSSLRDEVASLLKANDTGSDLHFEEQIRDNIGQAASEFSLSGRLLGHYQLLERIGTGGMAEVYLGRDVRLGRKVALKLLPHAFRADQERVRRFEQEARAASALNHPNIVTIHDIAEADGQLFIATEYVQGTPLDAVVRQGPMSVERALSLVEQIACALAAAHEAGVIHRDIKPGNVIVRPDGLVKVLDFGLARMTTGIGNEQADTAEQSQTVPGTLLGTPAYMSPEQARGVEVDERSDLWSLGAVMYELLAGRPAFDGAHTVDILASVLEKQPRAISATRPDVGHDVDAVLAKLLAKDRAQRYSSARAVIADIQTIRNGSGQRTARTKQRRKAAAVAAGAILAVVAGVGVFHLSDSRSNIAPERWLTYSIAAQTLPAGDARELFVTEGAVLERGSRFSLKVTAQESGFFYLVGEDTGTRNGNRYSVLFPVPSVNGGSAVIETGKMLQTGWYQFGPGAGKEKVWLVWAKQPRRELEALRATLNVHDKGAVTGISQVQALDSLFSSPTRLTTTASAPERHGHDVTLRWTGDILVSSFELAHR